MGRLGQTRASTFTEAEGKQRESRKGSKTFQKPGTDLGFPNQEQIWGSLARKPFSYS